MIDVIETLDPARLREVGDYLATAAATGSPAVCGEHDPRWLAVLRDALGHGPVALIARDPAGKPQGYLPLCRVSSALFGRFLVSLPYLNRAGVVADSPQAAAALIDKAVELARQHKVKYLELRHTEPIEHPGLPMRRDEKVRMVLKLPQVPEGVMKAVDAKVRNLIRKGDKSELTLAWGGLDVLDDFYDVFAVNMRDLGTPVYAKKLFASILTHFSDRAELAVVRHKGQTIAGALLIHDVPGPGATGTFPGVPSSTVPSASSLREFNSTNANMWMYHHLLMRAISRGAVEFDFGRSSVDSGTYKFKKQWGALPRPTVWQYHVLEGDMNAMRPDDPRMQKRIERWQKLPVWVTRLAGPMIVRGIP